MSLGPSLPTGIQARYPIPQGSTDHDDSHTVAPHLARAAAGEMERAIDSGLEKAFMRLA